MDDPDKQSETEANWHEYLQKGSRETLVLEIMQLLRNRANTIMACAGMIRDEHNDMGDKELEEYAEMILKGADDIGKIITAGGDILLDETTPPAD